MLHVRLVAVAVGILLATDVAAARADGRACASAAESAEALIAEKKLVEAHTQLLVCVAEGCPKIVRQDCLRWLDDVSASTPSIVVRVRDARDKDVVDPTVTVDGAVAAAGKAIPVDPGRHIVVASRAGQRGTEEILVAEGEKRRLLAIQLVDTRGTRSESEPSQPAASAGPWPWAILGVSAVGFVAFGVLQITARAKYDDLKDSCSPRCDPSETSGVRAQVVGSAVGLGVGVVSLAGGLGLLWLGSKHASAPALTVDSTPGGARGALRVTF